jgi:quercetin dioxygenase-like cupin family protein
MHSWTGHPVTRVSGVHSARAKELIHVRQGTITVGAASQSAVLEAGDAIAFPGDVTPSYANPGESPARFSLAVFEPSVGAVNHTEVSHG